MKETPSNVGQIELDSESITVENDYEEEGLGVFLNTLKRFPEAYSYFLSEAYRLRVLRMKLPSTPQIHPVRSVTKAAVKAPTSVSVSALPRNKTKTKTETMLGSVRSHSTKRADGKVSHHSELTGSHMIPIVRDAMGRVTKVYYLDPSLVDKHTVTEKYREICGLSSGCEIRTARLSADRFRGYLEQRYPCEMTDIMVRLLDFTTSKSPPQYFTEIERLITLRDDRLLQAAFDMFDLDKDKLITTKDAFHAIEKRLFDTYDSDLVKLQRVLQIKKGMNEGEGRREGITYSEFKRLDFVGSRPQVIVDFIQYVSGLNVWQLAGYVQPYSRLKKEAGEELSANCFSAERYIYLTSLVRTMQENVMSCYPDKHKEALLARFQEFQCGEVRSAIITTSSFQAGFV